jgi:hypothetical protein
MTKPKSGISRRTVVKGTAWAVPAVVVASAAPAMAAGTSQCVTATFGGNSCKQPGVGQNAKGYRLQICFTNTCAVPAVIFVKTVRGNTGSSPTQNVNQSVTVPANTTTPVCIATPVIYCNGNSVNFIEVVFTVNGGADISQLVPSPPDCATPETFCD